MPLLSIITITYNAAEFIEPTLKSITSQSSQHFEYIVIDGASSDETLMKLKNIAGKRIDKLVSEPDSGIYDAMNKGLKIAKGDYVWFMNAGDEIYENDTVEKLLKILEQDPDVVYSDTLMLSSSRKPIGLRTEVTPHKLTRSLSWQDYKMGMLVCHQSFISKKNLVPDYIENNLSADIDWEIKCLKKAGKVVFYPDILSKYLLGGISSKKKIKSLRGRYKILKNHFGFWPNLLNHFKIIFRSAFK